MVSVTPPAIPRQSLGRQGAEEITAEEWARRLGIIHYEVVTGFGPRLPRRYLP